jgi:hypothetical protein
VLCLLSLSRIRLATAIATILVPMYLFGQNVIPEQKLGIIIGTAVDIHGDPVPNATVQLKSLDSSDPRVVTTTETESSSRHLIREGSISRAFAGRSQGFRPRVADPSRREPVLHHPSWPLPERRLLFGPLSVSSPSTVCGGLRSTSSKMLATTPARFDCRTGA